MHGFIVADRPLQPLGFERIAAITGATVVGLTVPAGAVYAYIQADGGDLRWRDDGTAPSDTVGHVLADGVVYWRAANLRKIQFRENAGGSGTAINISYYKPR